MWVTSWLFKWQLWLNVIPHFSNVNDCTPMLGISQLFKWQLWFNVASHVLQGNCTSPLWVASWLFKSQQWFNVASYFFHRNGFSPLWVGSWLFQLTTLVEFHITFLPCKWLHHVGHFMTLQVTTVIACCIACFALKLLHSLVGFFMTLPSDNCGWMSNTFLAGKWLLSHFGHFMTF